MNRPTLLGGAFAGALFLLALAGGKVARERTVGTEAADPSSARVTGAGAHAGLLHGRVTLTDGTVYEGRLRFGGDEEALWGNSFNGLKPENPWVEYAPSEWLPKESAALEIFGIEVKLWERQRKLSRPFMARLGEIARIDGSRRDLRVTLKSGSVFELDRYGADDLADGLRVWDKDRGVVDIGEWKIRTIEFLAAAPAVAGPRPLYGTVRTSDGEFTGIIQWDREACLDTDELIGRSADGDRSVQFGSIASIAKRSTGSSRVTLLDGTEIELSETRAAGEGNRGIYVDDERYGRVLVSWDAFERIDFKSGGNGPGYDAFASGRPLTGTVTTRSGERLAGRLVYDLDESETTETLDAPARGVDYIIPFARVASIVLPAIAAPGGQASVILRSGEELRLELAGDLSAMNAGVLIFSAGSEQAEYVPWADVQRIVLDASAETERPGADRS